MSKTHYSGSMEDANRFDALLSVYMVGWFVTLFLCEFSHKLHLSWVVFLAAFSVRSLLEMLAIMLLPDKAERDFGPYFAYLAIGVPLLGFGTAIWAILKPGGYWAAADTAVYWLTVFVPMVTWALCQPPVVGGKRWRKEQAERSQTPPPEPTPAYSYESAAPDPWPVRPPEPTPLEKELARIDAEAKEFNLDPDLVEAEKDRARAEFAGTH